MKLTKEDIIAGQVFNRDQANTQYAYSQVAAIRLSRLREIVTELKSRAVCSAGKDCVCYTGKSIDLYYVDDLFGEVLD